MFEKSTSDARPEDKIHPCVAGQRCRAATVADDERRPAFTTAADTLCDGCRAAYGSAINRLIKDYAMLAVTLRERRGRVGEMVHSSASPAILIDQTSDRLMCEIVEWADFAADLVSNALDTEHPNGRRKLPKVHLDGKPPIDAARPNTVAMNAWEQVEPTEAQRLTAYLAIIDPHLDALAAAPKQDVQVWAQPQRCTRHSSEIIEAKRILDLARGIQDRDEAADAAARLQAAYAEAGECNECCGWSEDGRRQARQDVELSGLDVLNRLTRLHHLTRKHLGHTRLRHYYPMPCPRCGSPVGRDDGTAILNCENDQCTPHGPSAWTEREYEYLTRLMTDDETALATVKYLLAEAYSWLDGVQKIIDKIADDPDIDAPGAGRIIVESVTTAIAGHVRGTDRRIATDKAAAQGRQTDEENWAWKTTKPYNKPPKPKHRQKTPDTVYATSSLSTLTDIDITDGLVITATICGVCHLTKPCDCDGDS